MPKEILINSTGQTSLFIKMINNALGIIIYPEQNSSNVKKNILFKM